MLSTLTLNNVGIVKYLYAHSTIWLNTPTAHTAIQVEQKQIREQRALRKPTDCISY